VILILRKMYVEFDGENVGFILIHKTHNGDESP
jgi:hypothetical protein